MWHTSTGAEQTYDAARARDRVGELLSRRVSVDRRGLERDPSMGLERDGAVEFAATLWPDDPRRCRTHDNRARGVSLGSVRR